MLPNLFNEKKRAIVLEKKMGQSFISRLKKKIKIIKILRSKDITKK